MLKTTAIKTQQGYIIMIKSTEKPLGFTRFGHVDNQIQIYCVIDMLIEISRKIWSSMQINEN